MIYSIFINIQPIYMQHPQYWIRNKELFNFVKKTDCEKQPVKSTYVYRYPNFVESANQIVKPNYEATQSD